MALGTPKNEFIQPLLTDLYQITMAYTYWKSERHNQTAVFELFFRNNPFNEDYTVFAGLSDCINFISDFTFTQSGISCFKKLDYVITCCYILLFKRSDDVHIS